LCASEINLGVEKIGTESEFDLFLTLI